MTLNWHWWQGDRENWWEERWGCCQGWRQRKDATRRAREGPLCPNLSEICKIQFSLVIILLHTCSGSLFPSTGLFSRRVGQSRKWTLGNCCVGIALTKVNQKAHITYKTDQRSTSSGIKKLTSTERKKLEKKTSNPQRRSGKIYCWKKFGKRYLSSHYRERENEWMRYGWW